MSQRSASNPAEAGEDIDTDSTGEGATEAPTVPEAASPIPEATEPESETPEAPPPEAVEAADLAAKIVRAETEASRLIFTFAQDVQTEWDEARAEAPGEKLGVQENKVFEARRLQAVRKDELLNSSLKRVNAEKALGGRLGHLASRFRILAGRGTSLDQAVREARTNQTLLYRKGFIEGLIQKIKREQSSDGDNSFFEALKQAAKREHRSYGDVLGNAADEAKAISSQAKTELNEAIKSGVQKDIDRARLKQEAANQHFVMIRDEKRKQRLIDFLKLLFLGAFVTTFNTAYKPVKEGVPQEPQRGN